MKIKGHPILPAPGLREIEGEMALSNCDGPTALARILKRRQDVIIAEQEDPLHQGWEPSIWLIVRALIDWPWIGKNWEKEIRRRLNMDWEEFKKAMLAKLGFLEAVRMLLVLGGNRASKTELSAKLGMEMLSRQERSAVVAMHMSHPRSVSDQQPLFMKFMPPEWRKQQQTETTYIKYKRKTGFADNSFITPIGSEGRFVNYSQDVTAAVEGIEPDLLLPDELIPPDWVETLAFRLTTRGGRCVIGFTPVHGYTPTVQMFLEGAEVAMERQAYLVPKDGGPRDEAKALGLTEEEYREIWTAHKEKRAALAPQGRAEDVLTWLEQDKNKDVTSDERRCTQMGDKSQITDHKEQIADSRPQRRFEMLPRVLRCRDPRKAVVFFWSSDNPYGNPKEVIAELRAKNVAGSAGVRERFYGLPDKVAHGKFPKFSRRTHVIPASAIPTKGDNYLFVDPANGRNFFMTWIRVNDGRAYAYREWPGRSWIPEKGVPGPWTIPSGRKEGLNDGARGEGQGPWGFGTLRMKYEIARLEGWSCWKKWRKDSPRRHEEERERIPGEEDIDSWEEGSEDTEVMIGRYIDSRAASNPRMERDRPVTLQTDFSRLGLDFELTPGNDVGDGIQRINALLDFVSLPGDAEGTNFMTAPRLYFSEECVNTIFAMENWKYADGDKGACKDPVDNIRYFVDLGLAEEAQAGRKERGGYAYGQRSRRNWISRDPGDKFLPPALLNGKACRI